jgi:hypothetical protein
MMDRFADSCAYRLPGHANTRQRKYGRVRPRFVAKDPANVAGIHHRIPAHALKVGKFQQASCYLNECDSFFPSQLIWYKGLASVDRDDVA